jgi:hypothetical protein
MGGSGQAAREGAGAWRRVCATFVVAALVSTASLFGVILALDPYGARASGRATPIMNINQRFMYPQIVRSGRYDSAVFGTSTIRLLDPAELSSSFGARFANLGLNAGTPWEQMQLAALFVRHVRAPKILIFGLDWTWCDPSADREQLTFRAFPRWLYDENPLNDLAGQLNLKTLEIAGRVALNRLGLMNERIRSDGYEIFVPPESRYDLERARTHLHAGHGSPLAGRGIDTSAASALDMPALPWLDELLARVPGTTAKLLMFPPVHVSVQPRPGTHEAAVEAECKRRVVEIARRRHATVVDFDLRSPVTTDDSNYWDPLHYRIGIARRIAAALKEAHTSGSDGPDGFYRVLAGPARPSPL